MSNKEWLVFLNAVKRRGPHIYADFKRIVRGMVCLPVAVCLLLLLLLIFCVGVLRVCMPLKIFSPRIRVGVRR